MKKLLCALLILVFACLPASAASIHLGRSIDAKAMYGDLSELSVQLKRGHVDLFGNVSQQEWDAEVARIREIIPQLTPAQFYYELRHLIAMVGDAHTNISFVTSQNKYLRRLPFEIRHFADGWRLLAVQEQYGEYLGCKVIAINGVVLEQVFERARSIISCENDVWAMRQFPETIVYLDALEYLQIAQTGDEAIRLYVCDEDGTETQLEIAMLDEAESATTNMATYMPQNASATEKNDMYRWLLLNEQVMYVQYNRCQESSGLPMADFTAQVLEQMDAAACDRLVFDLRYNTGGNSVVIEPFLQAIAEYQEQNGLDVYVLIGPDTFSSGTIAMVQAKQWLNALLVGTPTGGAMVCYGDIQSYALPNMPLQVTYSTKSFALVEGMKRGEPMQPDVWVEQTFEDYCSGTDPVINWVMAQ